MRTRMYLVARGLLVVVLITTTPALGSPPGGHLNIEEVLVSIGDPETTLTINGTDLDFGGPLEVTLAHGRNPLS